MSGKVREGAWKLGPGCRYFKTKTRERGKRNQGKHGQTKD